MIRHGWLLAPSHLAAEITRAKRQADNGSAALEQLTLAEFIEKGSFDGHLRRTRTIYRRRRDTLLNSLRQYLPHPRSAALQLASIC